jgi:hypothetical protein
MIKKLYDSSCFFTVIKNIFIRILFAFFCLVGNVPIQNALASDDPCEYVTNKSACSCRVYRNCTSIQQKCSYHPSESGCSRVSYCDNYDKVSDSCTPEPTPEPTPTGTTCETNINACGSEQQKCSYYPNDASCKGVTYCDNYDRASDSCTPEPTPEPTPTGTTCETNINACGSEQQKCSYYPNDASCKGVTYCDNYDRVSDSCTPEPTPEPTPTGTTCETNINACLSPQQKCYYYPTDPSCRYVTFCDNYDVPTNTCLPDDGGDGDGDGDGGGNGVSEPIGILVALTSLALFFGIRRRK